MPSNLDIPSIQTLRQTFHDAVVGLKEINADTTAGSVYDHFAGMGAILWSWQAQRDRDEFRTLYFNYADGQELTDYVSFHDGIDRILDTAGNGFAYISRPTSTGGSGTIWRGTRIFVIGNSSVPIGGQNALEYETTQDVVISSTQLTAVLPIQATVIGSGSSVDSTFAKFDDINYDTSFVVNRIICSDGTDFEKAEEFRPRVEQLRLDKRVGYPTLIKNICTTTGAANVFLFQSDFAGDALDHGINAIYVGDSGFSTTDFLRQKIAVALESVRVLGADLFVLPIQKTTQNFDITIYTWDDPLKLNSFNIRNTAVASIVDYFNTSTAFSYDLSTLSGVIRRMMPNLIYKVVFNSPTISAPFLTGISFPATLTKYIVNPSNIAITLMQA